MLAYGPLSYGGARVVRTWPGGLAARVPRRSAFSPSVCGPLRVAATTPLGVAATNSFWGRFYAVPGARPSTGRYDHDRDNIRTRAHETCARLMLAARMWEIVGLPSPELQP